MKTRAWFARAFLVSCLLALSTARITAQEHTRTDLDEFFAKTIASQKYVGLGACVLKKDRMVWEGYYGYADRERMLPLGKENIFQLASLSKVVTAFAAMILCEQGKIGLDDDVNSHLPFRVVHPVFPDIPITFRMLLNHTAGFADVTPTGLRVPKDVGRPPSAVGDSPMSLEEYVRQLLVPGGKYYSTEYFGETEPGTQYSYSNIGYALLGYLVEKISGEDFAEFCRKNIFTPLGMRDTGWHLRDLDTTRVVFGYNFSPNDSVPNYRKVHHFGEPGYPSGMLRTSTHDFGKFLMVLLNGGRYGDVTLLKPETVALMLSPQGMKNISSRTYRVLDRSLAWNIIQFRDSELYTMNGFSGSIFADAYFSVKGGFAIFYYFTGINMKNMAAVPEIAGKLYQVATEVK
jgi:CubicO group peptidase (beta-lactamase class C family)